MGNSKDKCGATGSSRGHGKVSETGVGHSDDDNIVMRVKNVDEVYRGESAELNAAVPSLTIHSQTAQLNKKPKNRRKRTDQTSTLTARKKVKRTRTARGEEEETITLNLRKSDTTIDVVVKSPVKKRKTMSRRLTEGGSMCGGGRQTELQGTSQIARKKKHRNTTNSYHVSGENGTELLEEVESEEGRTKGKEVDPGTMMASSRSAKLTEQVFLKSQVFTDSQPPA